MKAQEELIRGIRGMLGKRLRVEKGQIRERAIVLGTIDSLGSIFPDHLTPIMAKDGFWISEQKVSQENSCIIIQSPNDRGVLYGVFSLLGMIARGENINMLNEVQRPSAPIRWVDHWDNLNGTIERGYAGPSIFFENDNVRNDLPA